MELCLSLATCVGTMSTNGQGIRVGYSDVRAICRVGPSDRAALALCSG